MNKKVAVVMGSDSDYEIMEESVKVLRDHKVDYEVIVTSAHRTPERTREFASSAEERGIAVFIVGAGCAAHLAGVIAADTILPVIGVPIDASPLRGVDALYATVQMPGGIPVATMAIGKAGATNAALLALEILALQDSGIRDGLLRHRKNMAEGVAKKNEALQSRLKRE